LSNHLGNVLVTISDKKIGVNDGTYDAGGVKLNSTPDDKIDYYTADVVTANDYYPFGMGMPGRKFADGGKYRYGFNGKELDKETSSTTTYDYGFRIYSPALGRFLSIDPLIAKYPELTPYQFASNTPIQAVDLDGAESMFGWSIGTPPGKAQEVVQGWQDQHNKITSGTASGIKKSVSKTWSFITSDAWKAKTWKNLGLFIEEAALDMSTVKIAPSPTIDAKAQDFKNNVLNGNAFTRSEYFGEFGTDFFTGYVSGKVLGVAKVGVAKYMSGTFTIGSKTIKNVTAHLEQFGVRAENTIMLDRMKKIANKEMKATDIDINFAKHELREAELMKSGLNYEKAHEAVLKEQNMYHRDYEKKLYTEEALKAGNEQMTKEATKGN
jgi:RHS repeat-associated protein